jgi:DNA-binding MarR family transcriptional regulator
VSGERAPGSVERVQGELAVLFRRARAYFHDAAKDVDPGLSPAAYALLVHLVDVGPRRSRDLVAWFGSDKGAISRQVGQLESLALVRRASDPADGRAQVIEATAEGRSRAEAARDRHRTAVRAQLADWIPDDVDRLADLLGTLNATLARSPDPASAGTGADAAADS